MKKILSALFCLCSVVCAVAQNATMRWTASGRQDTIVTVWKGERIAMEGYFLLSDVPAEPLVLSCSAKKGIAAEAGILGGVITDDGRHCGAHNMNLPTYLAWDVIDTDSLWTGYSDDNADGRVKVFCSVDVPRNIKTGKQYVEVRLVGKDTRTAYAFMGIHLNVLDKTLPKPIDYKFHTDFWQQPYSVSRYYGVERWSREHMELLRPYMKLLARAGQKCISTILFYEPWGDQSFDKFSPMVQTTLKSDSTWAYDYTIFDKWVELMYECGIDHQINCYGMIPWDMNFRYWDEAKGDYTFRKFTTADKGYEEMWTAFLKSFAEHLRKKGWFEKTCIAMDERAMHDMMRAYNIAQKAVPGIQMALAGNYHKELSPLLHDYSIAFAQSFPADTLAARKARGQHSTLYTCCTELRPNLFTSSHPLEGTYLPLFAVANGLDGYLHWSWMNWAEDPLHESRFRLFPAGDTYVIYPDNNSSVRWERYIEGVQMAEKVRLERERLRAAIETLDQKLRTGKSADIKALDDMCQKLAKVNEAVAQFQDGDAFEHEEIARKLEALRALLNE